MSPTSYWLTTTTAGLLAGLAGLAFWRQHRALARARYAARHDDTTGLPNRRAFTAALTRALRTGNPVGVVLLDLDRFKRINDTWGHQIGNDVLAAVGQRLTCLERPVLMAARLSGDEFALLAGGRPHEIAGIAVSAWRAIAHRPVVLDGQRIVVQASIGYATSRLGSTARGLLHAADMAMYHAKRNGSAIHTAPASTAETDLPAGRVRDLPRN
ncbi:MAG: GGDEF domain-containing protein [Actinocatenispora sp.]